MARGGWAGRVARNMPNSGRRFWAHWTPMSRTGPLPAAWRRPSEAVPATFAFVMATGSVALAAHAIGFAAAAAVLWLISGAAYVALWGPLTALLVSSRPRIARDLADAARAPAYLTVVAATGVLGVEGVQIGANAIVGQVLWAFGLMLWAAVLYSLLFALMTRDANPAIGAQLGGSLLLAVVATQSVAALGALLPPPSAPGVLFVSLVLHVTGVMLYVFITSALFARMVFLPFAPRDFDPAYWITMGAVAISGVAGTLLIADASRWVLLREIESFLRGIALSCWAAATWWIPLLVVLQAWRWARAGMAVQYDARAWAAVFPLGMYALCTFEVARTFHLAWLRGIATASLAAGGVAWTAVLLAMLASLAGRLPSAGSARTDRS